MEGLWTEPVEKSQRPVEGTKLSEAAADLKLCWGIFTGGQNKYLGMMRKGWDGKMLWLHFGGIVRTFFGARKYSRCFLFIKCNWYSCIVMVDRFLALRTRKPQILAESPQNFF